ncbi:MAG: sodium-dependent transporter [Lachnospiraceae bacterium]|nr:sodium-dependent transporter [Lachnospiraceae bacterium]
METGHHHKQERNTFSGSLGFVLAAAGSAVGLGNIWRFPYLAAKNGGGLFLLIYIILALTFGFTLLLTEVAIGRKTESGPLVAYGKMHERWGFLGLIATVIPAIILPYYSLIGGWVLKYFTVFATGGISNAAEDGFFGGFITAQWQPIIFHTVFFAATALIIYRGVNEGIEKLSRILMPILVVLVVGIAVYSCTLSYTDADGVTRTGLQGMAIYLIPDFTGLTFGKLLGIIMEAMGQLFYSLSIAMGIMIAYGSYLKKDADLPANVNRIEIFDTGIAVIAGLMIIPAVFTFMGRDAMSAGPGLMFISLPKVFQSMGKGTGTFIGVLFFLMVIFAALTSCISILEAIVSSLIDRFHMDRKKATILASLYGWIFGIIVALGYNVFYFEYTLPNGAVAQILDIFDYVSNNILMPLLAILTCVLVGWVLGPKSVLDEAKRGSARFAREGLFVIMLRFVCPVLLALVFLKAFGFFA